MKAQDFPITVKRGSVVVKIYRTETRGHAEYVVTYYDRDHRRREKFADLDEAKREAAAKATALCNGELDVLKLDNADRTIYVRACNAIRPLGMPLDLAAVQFAQAKSRLGETPLSDAVDFYLKHCPRNLPRKTVSEVYAEILAAKENDRLSDVYLRDLRFRLGAFEKSFRCQISDITASQVNEYLRGLKHGARTRNNHRMAISTLIRFAESCGYLPKGHLDLADIAKAKQDQTSIEIFTPTEMISLLTHAGPGLAPFIALAGFAGLRTAEILRQDWKDIDLKRRFIRVTAAKGNTAQKRLVPISANLVDWLAPYARPLGLCCEYSNIANVLARLATNANVKWKHNGLRHSFISYRAAQTRNIPQVAMEAGNSVAVVNRHYRELVTPAQARAWFGIRPKAEQRIVMLPTQTAAG